MTIKIWGRGFFLSIMIFSGVIHAADLYVAKTGHDSNPGTEAAPLRTLQKAGTVATPGTIVHLGPGSFYSDRMSELLRPTSPLYDTWCFDCPP